MTWIRRRARLLGGAAVVGLLAFQFTPVLSVLAVSNPTDLASTTAATGLAGGFAADPKSGCKPDKNGDHPNNDNDKKKCPPPVVPEAPLAVLLPLSAGVMIGGAYALIRLRRGNEASA